MLKGKIVKNISDTYTVIANSITYECKARGKFRELGLTPLVGDEVEFNEEEKYILKILPRQNELKRPNISNIDVALIVTSVKKPDLSLNLLDKEISSILLSKVTPIICFTKLDLLNKKELKNLKSIVKYYKSLDIKVFTNQKPKKLIKYLKNKYVVLTGQTGAGKSSLINKIDSSFHLKEGEISEALGRGKHTTRHTEFHLVKNVYFADTPGFSSLDLNEFSKEQIRDSFTEFKHYPCEYKDCMHTKENDCNVKKAVTNKKILESRYNNYVSFIKK